VTFSTKDRGDLTISRKTGLLLRQTMPGANGAERVMELKDLRLNPGQAEITKISADWKTEGAKPLEGEMITLFRRKFIIALVEAVDNGEIKAVDLEKLLSTKREAIQEFVGSGFVESRNSLAGNPKWDAMLDKKVLEKTLKGAVDQGILKDVNNVEDVESVFSKRELRVMLRDGFVQGITGIDELSKAALGEILGVGKAVRLPSETPDGKAAAEMIEKALVRAYFTVLFDRKMLKLWGPPKD
jgi:hypothetical protein